MTTLKCPAITSAGYQCINPVPKNAWTCATHDRSMWCGRPTTTTGYPCKRRAGANGAPCTKHTDRTAT